MFGLGKQQDTPRASLVLVVGSSSVRASLVLDRNPVRPLILDQYEQNFISNVSSFKQYLENMNTACTRVVEKIVRSSEYQKPFKIQCILERPWYRAKTFTFTQEADHEFLFERSSVTSVLKDHAKQAKTEIEKDYFSGVTTENIEKKVVHMAVNGYEVDSIPNKLKLRKIDITTYVSFVPKPIIESIENAIRRHIHADCVFSSSQLAFFVVARDMLQGVPHALLVSVGDDFTEISFLENGALLSTAHFAVGSRKIHEVSNSNVHIKTLISHLRAHQKIQHSTNNPHQKILHSIKNAWLQEFSDSLKDLSLYNAGADTILLLADQSTSVWVSEALADSRLQHFARSGSPFRVILVSMDALDPYIGSKVPVSDLKSALYAIFSIVIN